MSHSIPTEPIYLLGGYQTDFAQHWSREGATIDAIMGAALAGGLAACDLAPTAIAVGHVGNFAAELFAGQGQLGGIFAALDPALAGIPVARHEAACASGSVALLAALADLAAGHYDLACVLGVEQMRQVSGAQAAANLGAAAWVGREAQDEQFPWPALFATIADTYDARYGLDVAHLRAIGQINFANARRNPNAQTRGWTLTSASFGDDDRFNPPIAGRLRKQDCGQITDGAAVVFLANGQAAASYARRRGLDVAQLPRIQGWGHRVAPMLLADKLAASADQPYVFPFLRAAITDAWRRAGIPDGGAVDVIETHDCFTISEYLAIDHFGLTPPGQSWRAIEDGTIAFDGPVPVNPSGGLIGTGHPVGATGVRMALDAFKQVTGTAGAYQVPNVRRAQTLNIGGSLTTCVSLVIGRDA